MAAEHLKLGTAVVVDPFGRANGFRDGRVVAQTPGARVRMTNGAIVVTLPNVPDGAFATTVAPSAGGPVPVFTTVSDRDEEPVTIESSAEAGGASATSGVELRRSGDKPSVRALNADEAKQLPDAKVSPKKITPAKATSHSANSPARQGASTTQTTLRVSASPVRQADATEPAATPRRTATPTPSPTRR